MWKQSSHFQQLLSDSDQFLQETFRDSGFDDIQADILRRIERGNNFKPRMLYSVFGLLKGSDMQPNDAPPILRLVSVSLEIFHQVASVLDDISDGDYRKPGALLPAAFADEGMAGVVASQLLARGDQAILEAKGIRAETKVQIVRDIALCKDETAFGQYVDLFMLEKNPEYTWIQWYLQQGCKKTNAMMKLPVSIAATLACSDSGQKKALEAYALHAGTAHQIGDDFADGIESESAMLSFPFAYGLDHDGQNLAQYARTMSWKEEIANSIRKRCNHHLRKTRCAALELVREPDENAQLPFRIPELDGMLLKATQRIQDRESF